MLKRLGLYTAALFATLALTQLPTASAQNRYGNDRSGYNTHQTINYTQSVGERNGNSYAAQSGYNGRQSQFDSRRDDDRRVSRDISDHGRNSRWSRRADDDDNRWER